MIRGAAKGTPPKGNPPQAPPEGRKLKFGGYSINFKGCKDSVEVVFGSKPIGPSVMTKKLWSYVKRKRLAKR